MRQLTEEANKAHYGNEGKADPKSVADGMLKGFSVPVGRPAQRQCMK